MIRHSLPRTLLLVVVGDIRCVVSIFTFVLLLHPINSFHQDVLLAPVIPIGQQHKLLMSSPSISFLALSHRRRRYNTRIAVVHNDDDDDKDYSKSSSSGGTNDDDPTGSSFSNFNPFNYNAANFKMTDQLTTSSSSSLPSITIDTTTSSSKLQDNDRIISLRQQRMKEITTDLLATGGNVEAMQQILQDNRDFLIEPLEDKNCVLDESMAEIYHNCYTTEDRYRAYERTMTTRISNARNRDVKQLLTLMKDYVLSCEVKQI
jgi:hypothetical protein